MKSEFCPFVSFFDVASCHYETIVITSSTAVFSPGCFKNHRKRLAERLRLLRRGHGREPDAPLQLSLIMMMISLEEAGGDIFVN